MNKAINIIMLTVGFIFGAAVTRGYFKKKFENLARKEIDSVKDVYSQKSKSTVSDSAEEKARAARDKPSVVDYVNKAQTLGYTNYSDSDLIKAAPYRISPDVFGELDSYDRISLTYYSDGVLADENDAVVENADDIVGHDFFNGFGEYEDDSVYVRNDSLKTDYEILADQRRYSDVRKGYSKNN